MRRGVRAGIISVIMLMHYSPPYRGLHFDSQLASRADFWLTTAVISLEKGGVSFPSPQTKNIYFSSSVQNGHFGLLKTFERELYLDTEFRFHTCFCWL
jgi:hypothetical protein